LAAWEYYSISNVEDIDKEDRLAMLQEAITCAVLSPAGNQKFRLMAALHKDERCKQIDPHYDLLNKLFLGHIIKWADAKKFEDDHLQDHQKATGEDGYTVL
jgi:COP9 signalosome complex subunit 4